MSMNPCNATKARIYANKYLSTIDESKQLDRGTYAFLGKNGEGKAGYVICSPIQMQGEVCFTPDAHIYYKYAQALDPQMVMNL